MSVSLFPDKYLVLMGVIYMLMKTLFSILVITVTVLIFLVFHVKKRAHQCCLHLEDYAPEFLMAGIVSTIILPF